MVGYAAIVDLSMKILFATAEVSPIAKTGGLGDVCGSLPKALAKLGHDVVDLHAVLPAGAGVVREQRRRARSRRCRRRMCRGRIGRPRRSTCGRRCRGRDIPLILVGNDYYFHRPHIYSPRFDGYDDGIERFTFFCRAVVRGCELLGIAPDIVHAHDWHTALLPVYLHSGLRGSDQFRDARSVYTIHNLNYQGIGGARTLRRRSACTAATGRPTRSNISAT